MAKATPGWGAAITVITTTITTAGITTTMATGTTTMTGTIITIMRTAITTNMFTLQTRMRQGPWPTATCISAGTPPRPMFRG